MCSCIRKVFDVLHCTCKLMAHGAYNCVLLAHVCVHARWGSQAQMLDKPSNSIQVFGDTVAESMFKGE